MKTKPQIFADILTDGVKEIRHQEKKKIKDIHQWLADAIGVTDESIKKWRNADNRYIPQPEYVKIMAEQFASTGYFDAKWLKDFLEKGGYPKSEIDIFITKLFSDEEMEQGEIDSQSQLPAITAKNVAISHPMSELTDNSSLTKSNDSLISSSDVYTSETEQAEFAEILTFAVRSISITRSISIKDVHQLLANSLGLEQNLIRKWRDSNHQYLPHSDHVKIMAEQFASTSYFDPEWIRNFLKKGKYPEDKIDALVAELFLSEQTLVDEEVINNSPASITQPVSDSPPLISQPPNIRRNVLIGVVLVTVIAIAGGYTLFQMLYPATICGEPYIIDDEQVGERFLASQRVVAYTPENAPNGLMNKNIRAVEAESEGVFVGYFHDAVGAINGVSFYARESDPRFWAQCGSPGELVTHKVTDLLRDSQDRLWVASDGKGISMFDGRNWHHYPPESGLIDSHAVYQIVEFDNKIWAATGEGVAVFDGNLWRLEYEANNELHHNQVKTLAFGKNGDIWVGHINEGISYFSSTNGWQPIRVENSSLSSNKIEDILIIEEADGTESVWIATGEGGINHLHQGQWQTITIDEGLPGLSVYTLEKDRYGRIWAGTEFGLVYLDGTRWVPLMDLPALAIDFAQACPQDSCPADDIVWIGARGEGLVETRLPYNDDVIRVDEVCFVLGDQPTDCVAVEVNTETSVVTATLPTVIQPNDSFFMEIHATPINGFELRGDRGDFLSFASDDKRLLASAFEIIPVNSDVVITGDEVIFSNRNDPFIAPEPRDGAQQETIVSPWRMWVFTRHGNPEIRIVFTVEKEE